MSFAIRPLKFRAWFPHGEFMIRGIDIYGEDSQTYAESKDDKHILMQWTGITLGKGKNKKFVYAGDIVTDRDGDANLIYLDYGPYWSWRAKNYHANSLPFFNTDDNLYNYELDPYFDKNTMKILGNMFENPKLLKKHNINVRDIMQRHEEDEKRWYEEERYYDGGEDDD